MTTTPQTIKFGVEVETHLSVNNLTHVGTHYSPAPVSWLPAGWKVGKDVSIRRPAGRKDAEFVPPILQGEDGLAEVHESVQKIKAQGARVNESCGVHVTITFPANDGAALARLINFVSHFEKGLFAVTGSKSREYNPAAPGGSWAKGLKRYGEGHARGKQKTEAAKKEAADSRYHALNLTHLARGKNRVEFRLFSGSVNADKIVAWVRLVLAIAEYALNTKRAVNFDCRSKDRRWGGEGESIAVQMFCRLGWLKWTPWGYKGHTYGDLLPVGGVATLEASTATLRRLAKKYDAAPSPTRFN